MYKYLPHVTILHLGLLDAHHCYRSLQANDVFTIIWTVFIAPERTSLTSVFDARSLAFYTLVCAVEILLIILAPSARHLAESPQRAGIQ